MIEDPIEAFDPRHEQLGGRLPLFRDSLTRIGWVVKLVQSRRSRRVDSVRNSVISFEHTHHRQPALATQGYRAIRDNAYGNRSLARALNAQEKTVDANFEKFAADHRKPRIRNTNCQLGNHYRHTQPPRMEYRFQWPARLLTLFDTQMSSWTVHQGYSRRTHRRRRQPNSSGPCLGESVPELFSKSK